MELAYNSSLARIAMLIHSTQDHCSIVKIIKIYWIYATETIPYRAVIKFPRDSKEFFDLVSRLFLIPAFLNLSTLKHALTKDSITMLFPLIEAAGDTTFLLLQLYPWADQFRLKLVDLEGENIVWMLNDHCLARWMTRMRYYNDNDAVNGVIMNPFLGIFAQRASTTGTAGEWQTDAGGTSRSSFVDTIFLHMFFDVTLSNAVTLMYDRYSSLSKPAKFMEKTKTPYRHAARRLLRVSCVKNAFKN